MKIRIENLRDGANRWTETIEPSELDLDISTYSQPVNVELEVEKRSGKIPVSVHVSTQGRYICDRCGEEFEREIGGDCRIIFIQRENTFPGEVEGDDLRSFLSGQPELDITFDVRDALLLSVPLKLVCTDDCKGLCAGCGVNLNSEACRCEKQADL